jgi:triacylglycerol lipase
MTDRNHTIAQGLTVRTARMASILLAAVLACVSTLSASFAVAATPLNGRATAGPDVTPAITPTAAPAVTSVARAISTQRNVIYGIAQTEDGTDIDLYLDVAMPVRAKDDATLRPAVIYFHGGGYITGSRTEGNDFIETFASGGYVAITIDYRLISQRRLPAAIDDGRAALAFVRRRADEWGIDVNRIGLCGYSAGAHLAALLAFDRPPACDHVRCAVLLGTPTNFRAIVPDQRRLRVLIDTNGDELDVALTKLDPVQYVDSGDPPTLLVHGDRDGIVPIAHMTRLADAMRDADSPVHIRRDPEAGHLIFNPAVYGDIAGFIDEHLGGQARPFVVERARHRIAQIHGHDPIAANDETVKTEGDAAVAPPD